MPDLSVLIAARHEQFLRQTIEDVLAHAQGDTDVIVVCDGELPMEPIPQHPRLQILLEPVSIGQRAAVNLAARASEARYVMKLDAHCSVAPGFDVALLEAARALGEDVTQIPRQFHLHAFNWRCEGCADEQYQGPAPTMCPKCAAKGTPGGPFVRVPLWERRQNHWRRSTQAPKGGLTYSDTWRFDADLHFQYWGELADRSDKAAPFVETLSCLGACWFLSRDRFWALGGLDIGHGSWGQMGTEISCKSWLSGGRMVTNRQTWFAHLFRTRGGDWGFPYPLSSDEVARARAYSRSLWLQDAWPGQVRPLRWLIDHFAPVPDWPEQLAATA